MTNGITNDESNAIGGFIETMEEINQKELHVKLLVTAIRNLSEEKRMALAFDLLERCQATPTLNQIQMTKQEYSALENTLGKLNNKLGHRFIIMNNALHDGYHIGIYDNKTNELIHEQIWASIEGCVDRIMEKIKQSKP